MTVDFSSVYLLDGLPETGAGGLEREQEHHEDGERWRQEIVET